MNHYQLRWAFLLAVAAFGFAAVARAADYPSYPIHIIVPYSPGGSSDVPMRAIAQQMSTQMDQSIVVENKPGAGSMLGTEYVVHAAPDGYTLLLASNPQAWGAALFTQLSFDPVADFEPISLFSREPGVLVINPDMPVHTLAEFIDYIKAHPGQINYASSGNGSAQQLFMEMFSDPRRSENGAHSLSRQRAGRHRRPCRTGACDHAGPIGHGRAYPRPTTCARWRSPGTLAPRYCLTCRRWRNPAFRGFRLTCGPAWQRRRARRARSSTS